MKYIVILFFIISLLAWCSNKQLGTNNNLKSENKKMNSQKTENIVSKTVPAEEFKKLIENWKYDVIDIRTPEELEYFGIISWMNENLDYYNTGDIQKLFSLDKNKKYLIYCFHGNRSEHLRNVMTANWFKYVIDLEGGIEWRQQAGFKLVKMK